MIYLPLTYLVGAKNRIIFPDKQKQETLPKQCRNTLEEHFTSFSFSLILFIFKTPRVGREEGKGIMRQTEMEKWKLRDKTTERRIVSCLTKKKVLF